MGKNPDGLIRPGQRPAGRQVGLYVTITMRSGRGPERKRALYRRIAELAHAYAGTEPRNVFVTLTENESIDWSLGDGVAQYALSSEAVAEG